MNTKQCEFANLPPKTKPKFTKYEKRKWGKALNDYLLEQSNTMGRTNGWCVCGYMRYCDYCKETTSCIPAIKQRVMELDIELDYKNYDFKKLLEELEK